MSEAKSREEVQTSTEIRHRKGGGQKSRRTVQASMQQAVQTSVGRT